MNERVLVISHNSFSSLTNNGKTFESFFGGIPKQNLAQLFFSSNNDIDFDYCDNYFRITDVDVILKSVGLISQCGNILKGQNNKDTVLTSEGKSFKSDYINRFILLVKKCCVLRDFIWKTRSWKTKKLEDWCLSFSPDMIFYVGGNYSFSHEVAYCISTFLKKPLITYFTDDYLIYPINRNVFDKWQKKRMEKFYRKTIDHSSLLFGIGDLMSKEYSKYFGKQFFPIMNTVSLQPYVEYKEKEPIQISYFGGLHLDRWKMIVRLAGVVKKAVVNVYTSSVPSEAIMTEFRRVGIYYRGCVEGMELKRSIQDSDILLHVESDDVYYKSLTRLSVSTKIPEYLMSGRLILGFGPCEVASMQLLLENNIGVVITSMLSDEELEKQVTTIIQNYNLRKEIGERGYKYALQHFDNQNVVNDFQEKIKMILNK